MPSLKRPGSRVSIESIAAAVYVLSLMLPAIVVVQKPLLWGAPRDEVMVGIQCLAIGWVTPPWYANAMLAIASIALACRRPGMAAGFSFSAIVLALSTFAYLGRDLRHVHAGYFAWLASMVLMFVAACTARGYDEAGAHAVENRPAREGK